MIDEKKNEESKNKGGAPKKSSYNVHQRISRIMSELDYVKKDKAIKDKSGKKMYSVTGHDNVTNMIHPLLVKHGVNIIPDMDDVTQEGNRTRVKIVFSVVNIDSPDDFFTQRWYAYGIDHSDKGIGKACSYAQRMFILKMFHLETGDKDVEEDDVSHIPEPKKEKPATKTEPTPREGNHPDYDKQLDAPVTDDLMKEIEQAGYAIKMLPAQVNQFIANKTGKHFKKLTCSEAMTMISELKSYGGPTGGPNDIPL
tara:strand:+ start:1175 stop:1936 length:762 start_codon:yes stop_codon:yes gene_type:complete